MDPKQCFFTIYAMQSLLWNFCNAIVAMQSVLCNLCYAIFAMQSLQCNLCCAIFAAGATWGYLGLLGLPGATGATRRQPEILAFRSNYYRKQIRTPQCKHCLGNICGGEIPVYTIICSQNHAFSLGLLLLCTRHVCKNHD